MTEGAGTDPDDEGGARTSPPGLPASRPPEPRPPAGAQDPAAVDPASPSDDRPSSSDDLPSSSLDPASSSGGPPSPSVDPLAETWRGVRRGLLWMRRLVLLAVLLPLAAAVGVLLGWLVGPVWALCAALPLAVAGWGWGALDRNWRSWRYAERADDLLISRGVLWRELTVVPYGRMQLVEVTSGPLERLFGLARLQLHTAAAATDAHIPGLSPPEATRLRDRLTELGEARSAGL